MRNIYIELVNQNKTAPICWYSKRIRRIVKNTMAAETLAMAEAIDAGYLISSLLSEILYENQQKIPVEGITDNYSLYKSAQTSNTISDRRLRIDLAMIREAIDKGELMLKWVPTSNQLSDILTKQDVDPAPLLTHISS